MEKRLKILPKYKYIFLLSLLIIIAVVYWAVTSFASRSVGQKSKNDPSNAFIIPSLSESGENSLTAPLSISSSMEAEAKGQISGGDSSPRSGNYLLPSFSNIDFLSPQSGYLCISDKFLKTTDGGLHWVIADSGTKLTEIHFLNAEIGYGVTTQSTLVRTTDGGASWQPVSSLSGKTVKDFDLVSNQVLFAAVQNENDTAQSVQVLRTENGGVGWQSVALPNDAAARQYGLQWSAMSWLSAQSGYLALGNSATTAFQTKALYRTADGGKSWTLQSRSTDMRQKLKAVGRLSTSGSVTGIRFLPDGTGYLGLSRGGIARSVDKGINFQNVIFDGVSQFPVPDLLNSSIGFDIFPDAGSTAEYIRKTTDGGKSWASLISLESIVNSLKIS